MELQLVDIAIIVLYLIVMIVVGFLAERRARGGLQDYFLGGNQMPWWVLSMSNATTMFDVSGTMWLVSFLYVYGLKSVFIPWLWPVFNQIFLMVYLSKWLRRSGALTGAEWITLRFGSDKGAEASRISVVLFALVSVIGFTSYAYVGIAKFSGVFLPPLLSPNTYALVIIGVTTLYTVVGGLYSVVIADVIQFVLKIVCCIAIGYIAMQRVSPEALAAVVPAGWTDITFGWKLDLDWSNVLPPVQSQIEKDGYTLFGAFFMMMVFKGVLVSMAGPAPNYDMQRILAARSSREAALMSGFVTVVLFSPRYFMVAGITVLALVLLHDETLAGGKFDVEQFLPMVIRDLVPAGLKGLMIAGLLAAFMSTFSGTINAAAAYLVNDVYKRYVKPDAPELTYVRASYLASVAVVVVGCAAGYFTSSVHEVTKWITAALWGGYAAPNVLKWHWWRFNGWGYFWGMMAGILGAVTIAVAPRLGFNAVDPLSAFPFILALSLLGSVAGSVFTPAEQESVLVDFYTRTRPWGWWGPIRAVAVARDPAFKPNRNLPRDAFNVVVGTIWQTAFVALPIYIVIRDWHPVAWTLGIIVVTSAILKFNWYDKLEAD
jgi:SSS family solute:Na+ symporter